MLMNFKDKYNVSAEYVPVFTFRSEKEELEHEAKMIMFRIFGVVENFNLSGKPLRKNELAAMLGVSPSYITQLYNGTKLMNFTMLAKLQEVFNITFDIIARSNEPFSAAPENTPLEPVLQAPEAGIQNRVGARKQKTSVKLPQSS